MWWFSVIVGLILFISFLSGLKEGAIKGFFSLVALIISLLTAGATYQLLASLLSFLPGENWENFFGFFIMFGIINAILLLIFLIPRKVLGEIWKGGFFFRLIGGVLHLLNAAIGFVVLGLVLMAFPFWGWLRDVVVGSSVVNWLVTNLTFVQFLILDIAHKAAGSMGIF